MDASKLKDKEYLKSIWETGKDSDFSIKCGDESWEVHQLVLCSQSQFFEKICGPGFKENVEKVITLHDDGPALVGRMLQWCYLEEYGDHDDDSSYPQKACLDVQMHDIGDIYFMEGLKAKACEQAGFHFEKSLRYQRRLPTQDILSVIRLAYTLTAASVRSIRREIFEKLRLYYDVFNPLDEFQELLKSNLGEGDFASDILTLWVETARRRQYLCECSRLTNVDENTPRYICDGCRLRATGSPLPSWCTKEHVHEGDSPDSIKSFFDEI